MQKVEKVSLKVPLQTQTISENVIPVKVNKQNLKVYLNDINPWVNKTTNYLRPRWQKKDLNWNCITNHLHLLKVQAMPFREQKTVAQLWQTKSKCFFFMVGNLNWNCKLRKMQIYTYFFSLQFRIMRFPYFLVCLVGSFGELWIFLYLVISSKKNVVQRVFFSFFGGLYCIVFGVQTT